MDSPSIPSPSIPLPSIQSVSRSGSIAVTRVPVRTVALSCDAMAAASAKAIVSGVLPLV